MRLKESVFFYFKLFLKIFFLLNSKLKKYSAILSISNLKLKIFNEKIKPTVQSQPYLIKTSLQATKIIPNQKSKTKQYYSDKSNYFCLPRAKIPVLYHFNHPTWTKNEKNKKGTHRILRMPECASSLVS